MGKWIADFFQPHAAAFRNGQCSSENFGRIFENPVHLVVAFDVEAGALKLHAIRVLDGFAGLDAKHHILGVSIVFAKVVAVVGRHQGQTQIFFELKQMGTDAMLHLQALILKFKIEIFFAEDIAIRCGSIARRLVLVFHQVLCNFTLQATGKADQTLGVLGKKFLADSRFVVKATKRSFRGDLHQIAIAHFVFGQDQEMVIRVTVGRSTFDNVIFLLAYIKLATHDRLHPSFVSRIHKVHCTKNVAMIGHGNRGHAELLYAVDKLFHIAGAIKHGVIGMEVQVDELGHQRLCLGFYVEAILSGRSPRKAANLSTA